MEFGFPQEKLRVGALPFQIRAGIESIAQIALIKSQGFAEGGIIPKGYELPTSTAKGDNTLILAKPGEVVLNQEHQSRAGGAGFFKSIGVPGFADSGMIPQQTINNITNNTPETIIKEVPVFVVEAFDEVREGQVTVKIMENV